MIFEDQQSLFVAASTSYDPLGMHFEDNQVPLFSKRSLESLEIDEDQYINMMPEKYENNFDVQFKYGFSDNGYTYFLFKRTPLSGTDDKPVLGRMCNGISLDSYIELPLKCQKGNVIFNNIKAATFSPVGSTLANLLKVPDKEKVLFVSFSEGSMSTICAYPLTSIKQKFDSTYDRCMDGSGGIKIGPGYLVNEERCESVVSTHFFQKFYVG